MDAIFMSKLNLEDLKNEYVGKTFNWLTVLDVYSGGKNVGVMFKCCCKCGKEINVSKRSVLSSHTKSCGCFKKSEEYGDYLRQWYANHPDECNNRSIRMSKFYNDNPNIQLELSKKRLQYINDNPNAMNYLIELSKTKSKENRAMADYSQILLFVDSSDREKLCNGDIRGEDVIKVHCSKCGKLEYRKLKNLFIFSRSSMKKSVPPVCQKCKSEFYSSKAEQEIADFISTFYSGECIRNTRDVISPLELDLYYPEKKIAIEFNGDYWHSSEFKSKDYHYNKFKDCSSKGVTLVSVFESEWNLKRGKIKSYLEDLFSGKNNKLSFNEDYLLMNNNYPSPDVTITVDNNVIESSYLFGKYTVYMCGMSHISNIVNEVRL